MSALSPAQLIEYREHGCTVVPGVFTHSECDALVDRMMAWIAGDLVIGGMNQRAPGTWDRTLNQHFVDSVALQWLLDPRLEPMLRQCLGGEPFGVQTMYFFKGSTQGRHQDQYYLPGCMSAWIALMDVDESNGTIWVQQGSQLKHLVTATELNHTHGQDFSTGVAYNDAVDALFESNVREYGLKEVPVRAKKGDVVFFHGVTIHRGGPIGVPDSFRHVLASHYVGPGEDFWPYGEWPRYGFDGTRHADTAEPTEGYHGHPTKVTRPEAIVNQVPIY